MSKNILFVFEGEKTESQIVNNLCQFYINEDTIIQSAYCTDIYALYKEIEEDEDLDTFVLLKNRSYNTQKIGTFRRNDFAEIYLFFDYDGHAPAANDLKISKLLDFFKSETDKGKLYLSYPMVEALKHVDPNVWFNLLSVEAKEKIEYKKMVHQKSKSMYSDLTKLTKQNWNELIELHLVKANYITNNQNRLPSVLIEQKTIFYSQLRKYILPFSEVSVLSSFPLFILDYYGVVKVNNILYCNDNYLLSIILK